VCKKIKKITELDKRIKFVEPLCYECVLERKGEASLRFFGF